MFFDVSILLFKYANELSSFDDALILAVRSIAYYNAFDYYIWDGKAFMIDDLDDITYPQEDIQYAGNNGEGLSRTEAKMFQAAFNALFQTDVDVDGVIASKTREEVTRAGFEKLDSETYMSALKRGGRFGPQPPTYIAFNLNAGLRSRATLITLSGYVSEGWFAIGDAPGHSEFRRYDPSGKYLGHYEGETVRGRPHGRGRRTYPNGDAYEGRFENGVAEGPGVYIKDGITYEAIITKGDDGRTVSRGVRLVPSERDPAATWWEKWFPILR